MKIKDGFYISYNMKSLLVGIADSVRIDRLKDATKYPAFTECMIFNCSYFLLPHIVYWFIADSMMDMSIYYVFWFIPFATIGMIYNMFWIGEMMRQILGKSACTFSIDKYLTDIILTRTLIFTIYIFMTLLTLHRWIYFVGCILYAILEIYVTAFLIYDAILLHKGGDLARRCIFIEQYALYVAGFALWPSMVMILLPASVSFMLFYVIFPIILYLAICGNPVVSEVGDIAIFSVPMRILSMALMIGKN